MMLLMHRSYQQVGDESDEQQSAHQVQGAIVGFSRGHSGLLLRGGDVVDELGADDGGE